MSNKNPKPVVVVDLETGKRTEYPSVHDAKRTMKVGFATVEKMLSTKRAYKKWYVYRKGMARFHERNIEEFRKLYAEQCKGNYHERTDGFSRMTSAGPLVSLRIDKHTVIMVTPDKANDKYAEQWRQKYNNSGKREAKGWIDKPL